MLARSGAVVAITIASLTACGTGAEPARTSGHTPAPAASAAATGEPSPAGPVRLGTTQTLDDPTVAAKATVYRYRQPLPSQFPPDRKGYVYAGADIRVCVTKVHGGSGTTVSWDPWSLTYADDTTVEPVSAWSDDWFTVPIYPGFGKRVTVGHCVRGWALFEVPRGKRPVRISYSPDDGSGEALEPLEWRLR